MCNIKITHIAVGAVGTNCYLVINQAEHKCVLIDPGDEVTRISDMIDQTECSLSGILLTHGHYDHIMAADTIAKKYDVEIYASEQEQELLLSPQINLSSSCGKPVTLHTQVWDVEGDLFTLGGLTFQVIDTPGHTMGGTCYYLADAKSLFAGDTLFFESIGRTDFPTGSIHQLIRSIKDKLFVLPDETVVYPGHGPHTSIGHEKQYNPFCQ